MKKKTSKKEQPKSKKKFVTGKTKPYTIVSFDFDSVLKQDHKYYPFGKHERLLYLGEIVHMPGHGIFANHGGKVLWAYHMDEFYIVPKEEV